ncbi:MAG: ORF6N domain-containing protein [Bacteroidales bacterium]|nr:ORF6N domain-containing protein [Bacteroidales bacterium]
MLDSDLAKLYQVETRVLNQAVKRNMKRFPPDFMFQLTAEEAQYMSSPNVTTSTRPTSAPPFAFTEQGVAMLSGVLKSDIAVNDLSEDMRQEIDNLYLAIAELSSRLEEKKNEPRPKIGFQQNIDK